MFASRAVVFTSQSRKRLEQTKMNYSTIDAVMAFELQ